MQPGVTLKHDEDFDRVLYYKVNVEVLVEGEVDYRGTLTNYCPMTFEVETGDQYRRGIVEVKTI